MTAAEHAAATPDPLGADNGTRQRLLAAAAEVVAERGYDRATVTDIARRAGLTTGAIYANFRDKGEMLLELISGVEERQDANMADMRSHGGVDPALFLQDTRSWVDPERSNDRALVLEARIACRRDPAVRDRLQPLEGQRLTSVADLISVIQDHGIVRSDIDPDTLALFILSIPLGVSVLEATGLPLPDQEKWAELIERCIAAFVTAEPAAVGAPRPAIDPEL